MSKVLTSGGEYKRPSWNYPSLLNVEHEQLQMLESVRNAVEELIAEIRGIRACSSVHKAFMDLDNIRFNTLKTRKKRRVK